MLETRVSVSGEPPKTSSMMPGAGSLCSGRWTPAHNPSSRDRQQRLFLLLQACNNTRQLAQLHAHILLNGFSQKNFIVAKLLSSCTALADLPRAAAAFRQVAQPSTTLFNLIIRIHSRSAATAETALLLYNQMRSSSAGCAPNAFTYSSLLNACARPSLLRQGEQLHARIFAGGFLANVFVETSLAGMYAEAAGARAMEAARRVFDGMRHRNVVSWNSMLAAYLRCGDMASAFRIFDDMPERNVVSWTTMIAGCTQTGRCRQALSLFHEMEKARVPPDQVTMVATLSACAELGDLELGCSIHARIDCGAVAGVRGRERLVSLDNSLIHMYAKCGDVKKAHRIFRAMRRRSTVTWTTMIAGLAMHGCGDDALALFWDMEAAAEKPDAVTFIAVLYACSQAGRIDDGRRCFKHMTVAYGIRPRVEHYGCMVDMLSRAGRLSEAQELIGNMPVRPNHVIWGTLLGGCRTHRRVELANYVGGKLMELHPDQVANYLVLLSNTYAIAKMWDDVHKVREKMVEMGVSKPVGRSWIHVNGVLHDFVAGDCSHGQATAIHQMVADIASRARSEGCLPDTSQMLLNVDVEEEKVAFLLLHSEKLAIAFELISTTGATSLPLRIMSNLRMCSDCHSLAKFVSKTYNREVIIRDQNRFHHFHRGNCSCKDYW